MMGIEIVLAFSTSNYDAMLKFLLDFGFVVKGKESQLCPLFNEGRGVSLAYGDFNFNLEESSSPDAKASFNAMLTDLPEDKIHQLQAAGYKFQKDVSLYGESYTIQSPDGGTFVIG